MRCTVRRLNLLFTIKLEFEFEFEFEHEIIDSCLSAGDCDRLIFFSLFLFMPINKKFNFNTLHVNTNYFMLAWATPKMVMNVKRPKRIIKKCKICCKIDQKANA